MSCGYHHTAAITSDGALYSWGYGASRQLGHGGTDSERTPRRVASLEAVRCSAVACGASHTICVDVDGAVYTWGHGLGGRLGHGSEDDEPIPRCVEALAAQHVRAVAAGEAHCAVRTDDQIYVWGAGGYGRLGLGCADDKLSPTRLKQLSLG